MPTPSLFYPPPSLSPLSFLHGMFSGSSDILFSDAASRAAGPPRLHLRRELRPPTATSGGVACDVCPLGKGRQHRRHVQQHQVSPLRNPFWFPRSRHGFPGQRLYFHPGTLNVTKRHAVRCHGDPLLTTALWVLIEFARS